MIKSFITIHNLIKKTLFFIVQKKVYNKSISYWIMSFFIILNIIFNILGIHNNFILKLTFTYFVFALMINSLFYLKIFSFISPKYNYPILLFQEFSNISFLYGLIFFCFYQSIFIYSLLKIFNNTFIIYNLDFNSIFIIYYGLCSLFTIYWFSYHLIIKRHPIKQIKIKFSFYTSCNTTLIFIFTNINNDITFSIISILVISFAWINYIITLVDNTMNT